MIAMIGAAALLSFISDGQTVVRRGKVGGHSFEVTVAMVPFEPNRRLIKVGIEQAPQRQTTVDSRRAWGAADTLPATEIKSLRVRVDGKDLFLAPSNWKDCFDTHLDASSFFAWLSKDGRRMVVKAIGGDGYGGYRVIWTLTRNGKAQRQIEGYDGSD